MSVGEFSDRHAKQTDIFYQGMLAFTLCVILGNLKVQQMHKTHYFFNLFFIYGSIGFYLSNLVIASKLKYLDSYGIIHTLFNQSNTYFAVMLMVLVTYGFDSAYDIFTNSNKRHLSRKVSNEVQLQEIEKENNIIIYNKYESSQTYSLEKPKKIVDTSNDIKKTLLAQLQSNQKVNENMSSGGGVGGGVFFDDYNYKNSAREEKNQREISPFPISDSPISPSNKLIKKAEGQ